MINPVNEIIHGMMQGAQMGNMLRRASIEQQILAQEQAKSERDAEQQDIQTRLKLAAVTRPVTGGAVEDTLDLSKTKGVDPSIAAIAPGPMKVMRTADKSRMVKHTGRDGSTFEGEILSPMEQAMQQVEILKATEKVKGQLELEQLRQKAAMGETPGAIAGANRTHSSTEGEKNRTFRRDEAGATRTWQEKQQDRLFGHQSKLETTRQSGATARNREDNAAADRRTGAAIAADDKRQIRADHGEARAIQKRIDDMQKEKRTLDAERQRIGQLAKSKDWKKDEKGLRTKGEAEYAKVSQRLQDIAKDEQELRARMDALYGRASGPVTTAEDLFKSYGR